MRWRAQHQLALFCVRFTCIRGLLCVESFQFLLTHPLPLPAVEDCFAEADAKGVEYVWAEVKQVGRPAAEVRTFIAHSYGLERAMHMALSGAVLPCWGRCWVAA